MTGLGGEGERDQGPPGWGRDDDNIFHAEVCISQSERPQGKINPDTKGIKEENLDHDIFSATPKSFFAQLIF